MALMYGQIAKLVLTNGLTILVNPMHNIPKVSMELWYHVGSKDEKSGEKGLAHLIEHMIFKGTQILSESDINVITHKLSGYTNAFTSHDATGYTFQFPTQHWQYGLQMLADCMRNARFDEQMLNSELKAVIQELKMYKDRYWSMLIEELVCAMFADHPYHYPIIGFKQDLWNLDRDVLFNFYKKHYVPNNAVLVVVGDVEPERVFKEAEKLFGGIPKDETYERQEFYHGKDLISKSVTLFRDVQHPVVAMAAVLPGAKTKRQYVYDVLSWVLGAGKGSRLTKKLVDELELVTSIETFTYDLEDATPFFICFEPKHEADISKIKEVIHEEIAAIIKDGLTQKELERATKKVKTALLSQLEKSSNRVSMIAQSYLFTGDENFMFNYTSYACDDLEKEIKELLVGYFSPAVMSWGQVLPLSDAGREQWKFLQQLSDTEDAKILNGRERNIEVEPARHAETLKAQDPKVFHFHKPKIFELKNGLKVFEHSNKELPKIDIVLTLKAQPEYDPQELQGLYSFVCEMLLEGTEKYPGTSLADELEQYGMSLSVAPGALSLTVLSEDFQKGLELLHEVLTGAIFNEKALEKVRAKFLTNLKFFWDDPQSVAGLKVREEIYQDHPYSKNNYGTFESLEKITRKDVQEFYKNYFSPDGARVAVVGDLHNYDVKKELEKYLGSWHGPAVKELDYPALQPTKLGIVTHHMNRDQVTLLFARPSITRFDEDFDKLLLFEQIFSGSSMASRLFQLRERSGLFYTITGSLAARADEQPGMFVVKTIVSLDRLAEAEKVIKQTIDTVVDSLTEQELHDAKQAVINAQVNNFATNKSTATAFLAVDRFKFPADYFDTRARKINAISLDEVKAAAHKYLDSNKMMTVKVGRVEDEKLAGKER